MLKIGRILFCLLVLINPNLYSNEFKLYFSPSNKVDRIIIETFKKAKKSIFIASYTFDWPEGCKLLNELAEKGVDVKILLNFLPKNQEVLKNVGIKKWDKRNCAMHAKFIVIDNEYVFVGSANFTESSMIWDSNNILFIYDQKIGKFFAENFISLWCNRALSQNSSFKTEAIDFYFSPISDCTSVIVNEVRKARESIKFAMFCFTSDIIGQEIIKAGIRGVKVFGIFENSQNPISNEYLVMKKIHLLKVKKDCFVENIHDKFLIIDDRVALTGSFNYTLAATRNIETLIVLKDPSLVKHIAKRWRYLWLWY